MRYSHLLYACIFITFLSCRDNRPDVTGIKADLELKRFEQSIFKKNLTDKGNLLPELQQEYGSFFDIFFSDIINADLNWKGDTLPQYLNGFLNAYQPLYDSAQKMFKNFTPYKKEIETVLKHVKFYFPAYVIPKKIITYIGPLDGYGDILTDEGVVIGLQHHMGSSYSLYSTDLVDETYPAYISRRFTPEYIPVNTASIVLKDLYPLPEKEYTLIEQMVEAGKRLYILKNLLPDVKEDVIIGYTGSQLEESYKREDVIWAFFLQNNLLQNKDYNVVKNYIGDSPKTQELGEASPGNIGAFTGWQIVKKYMSDHEEISMDQLMKTDPSKIYRDAKYKP